MRVVRVCTACFMSREFVSVQPAESSSFFAVSCPIAVSVISITPGSGAFEEGAKSVHSPAFWRLVAGAWPGYEDARRWLREHQTGLS